eukprot:366249-Chlamydomonas_euryale.AAC.2
MLVKRRSCILPAYLRDEPVAACLPAYSTSGRLLTCVLNQWPPADVRRAFQCAGQHGGGGEADGLTGPKACAAPISGDARRWAVRGWRLVHVLCSALRPNARGAPVVHAPVPDKVGPA